MAPSVRKITGSWQWRWYNAIRAMPSSKSDAVSSYRSRTPSWSLALRRFISHLDSEPSLA
jgi:hypothetical protein